MKVGNRKIQTIVKAFFEKRHWKALMNMFILYPNFIDMFTSYFFAIGNYPLEIKLRENNMNISINLYSHHDLLTVNEIFCRQDYYADDSIKNVVDIGSNIGISALYFLTRNNICKCYLYEPVSQNIKRLEENLEHFKDRYILNEVAVSDENETLEFGVEETGRYGGIGVSTGKYIKVKCIHINEVLEDIFNKCNFIDILKIDTEGAEIKTLLAIKPDYLQKIGKIYIEAYLGNKILLDNKLFKQIQYGGVCQLEKL